MKKSITIPHLTGGSNNRKAQVIEWMESINNPVLLDSTGGHLSVQMIQRMYDEAQTPSNNRPIVKVFYETNETEYVRNNPSKPSKRKNAARNKYMANLLGGKDGNDLLNLASQVGSRKAAVEILKSGSTKTPFNVEIPLSDEDEIQSLKMQGLTPSVSALVDEGFRSKLENTLKSYLGSEAKDLAEIDKGVLITDEGIEDFRQMLTVYHLAHQMNGPVANAIKGHVPRKHADLFDRLIPTFDDILGGENLVLFANSIIERPPQASIAAANFNLRNDSDTLLPSWLALAQPTDHALNDLKESLGEREVAGAFEILATGNLRGAFNSVLSSIRQILDIPFSRLFGILSREEQDDRQARLFDDLNENIVEALVSEYGRGSGYTNRKELAKAIMAASDEAYDRRLTDVFQPLRISINSVRRVRGYSPSGVPLRLTVDLNTFDAGDIRGSNTTARIGPGMYYIGNFDFRIPPIGWNRKWMNATAQIVHEYWEYIRPSGNAAANDGFMPINQNQSLNLPQILYLIAIRTKELYNYDLAPEEWMTLIKVLGGNNALSENYYTLPDDYAESLDALEITLEEELRRQREAVAGIAGGRRARRISAKPHDKSALPQLAQVYNRKEMLTLKQTIGKRANTLEGMMKELVDLREKTDRLRLAQTAMNVEFYDSANKDLERKLKKAQKDTTTWQEKASGLQGIIDLLEHAGHKIVEIKETVEVEKSPKMSDLLGRKLMELFFESDQMAKVDALNRLVEHYDIPGYTGQKAAELQKLVKDYFKNEFKVHDPKALEFIATMHEEVVEEMAGDIIDGVESAIVDSDVDEELIRLKARAEELTAEILAMPSHAPKADLSHLVSDLFEDDDDDDDDDDGDDDDGDDDDGDDDDDDDWSDPRDDWSDPRNPPLPRNPVLHLGKTGQVAIIGDTHGDHQANLAVLKHIDENYPDAKVVWNGDKVDGRFSGYVAGKDDLTNLKIINSRMMKNPKKYFTLQGNHERFLLSGFTPAGFWNSLTPEEQLRYEKKFAQQPVIATAGPALIVHGGLSTSKSDKPKNFRGHKLSDFRKGWLSNNNAWNPKNIFSSLWMRPDPVEYPNTYAAQKPLALAAGYNVLITGHTPDIGYQDLKKPFYDDPDFLAVSAQTTMAYEVTYILLDLDNQKLTVHTFSALVPRPSFHEIVHKEAFVHKLPDEPTNPISPRTNPMNCGCGQTPCKTYGTRRNPTIPMYVGTPTGRVKNLGSITAIVQVGRNIIKDVGEGIQDIYRSLIGGRQSMTEKRMAMAVAEMQADLERECLELGGNVVGNIQIDYEYPATGSDITLIAVADAFKTPKKNPASNYHKYEKKVISILKKEGGAAGLKALRPAFPKGTTKAKVVGMLKKMNHVVLHADGDYILMQGISNPPFDLPEKQQAINLGDAELAMKKLREWAVNHIDPKLKAKMASSPAGTKFYEISVGGEGPNDLLDVYHLLGQPQNFGTQVKNELQNLYNAKVEILINNSKLFTFKLYTKPRKKKSPKKNQPELMCIYKKSARSKPCGTPLREKKNPKGRYACRKCGAEYEMK